MTEYDPNDYEMVQSDRTLCDGCAFRSPVVPGCKVMKDDRFDCCVDDCYYIFVKREK